MAEKWETNDSARDMTRKFNACAGEINAIASVMVGINDRYLASEPSEFVIDDKEATDGH